VGRSSHCDRSEYRINDKLSIFGEITNLFDEKYATSTLVVDQASAGQAAYIPDDGRGFLRASGAPSENSPSCPSFLALTQRGRLRTG